MEGGVAIAEALTQNHTLLAIKLHDNFLSEGAGRIMADYLAKNTNLVLIDLGGNQLNHSTIKFIKKVCGRNKSIKKSFEVAPLLVEIDKLHQDKNTLPTREAELDQQRNSVEIAKQQIKETESKLVQIQNDAKEEIRTLQKRLQDLQQQLGEEKLKLSMKEDDMKRLQDEFDTKTNEIQASLNNELSHKEELEKALEQAQQIADGIKNSASQRTE
jgi:chromosome segregation ATPase